jgi:DNA-binding CsgD family transcriptional regulator/PAS domain-containing protein
MDDRERLSSLIGEIYDAALEPALWNEVLEKVAQFVGGSAASLFVKNAASLTGGVVYEHGTDAEYRQLYFDQYIKLDPTTTGQVLARVGEPIATSDVVPYDEFLGTQFYREWARPQGLVDFVGAVLDKSATSAAMFGVFRHERNGTVDEPARQRMRLIVPHVRRAVHFAKAMDLKRAEAATFADALDGLAAGLFLVDARGRITHANAAGQSLLGASGLLRRIAGRLTVCDPEADAALRDIFSALDGADGDRPIGTRGIALPVTGRDGERLVAHVLPLASGARRRAGRTYAAVAAVLVSKAGLELPSRPEIIAKAYNLTPTELRVLLGIVELGGVPEVATALGVAYTTVRTHLSRLFEKTGARRQADLVRLVAGFSDPLVE